MIETIKILSNPDAPRKMIDNDIMSDICKGCNKVFEINTEKGWNVCEAYTNPMIWGKFNACPMNIKIEIKNKKKINPIKYSKKHR